MATTSDSLNYETPPSTQEKGIATFSYVLGKTKQWAAREGLKTYMPRASDIIVTTYPKSGTTLLQHMCCQIMNESHADYPPYDDINVAAPWIDYVEQMGVPIPDDANKLWPRVFKTHSSRLDFENAGKATTQRHIVVIRNPVGFAASWLDFLYKSLVADAPDWYDAGRDEVKNIVHERFARLRLLGRQDDDETKKSSPQGNWFSHTESWLSAMEKDKIMILFYEEIVQDLLGCVEKVAEFIRCELTEQQLANVAGRCTQEAMAGDPRFELQSEAKVFHNCLGSLKAKEKRKNGFKKFKLSEETIREIEQNFQKVFGVRSYDQLRDIVNAKQMEQ